MVETVDSSEPRICKIYEKSKLKDTTILMILNEIEILKTNEHPNIVSIYEYFDSLEDIKIIMECYNGLNLYEYI